MNDEMIVQLKKCASYMTDEYSTTSRSMWMDIQNGDYIAVFTAGYNAMTAVYKPSESRLYVYRFESSVEIKP